MTGTDTAFKTFGLDPQLERVPQPDMMADAPTYVLVSESGGKQAGRTLSVLKVTGEANLRGRNMNFLFDEI